LTTDPGMGVIRHVDSGYDEAKQFANERSVKIPLEK
jgi:urocanate hydratase